MIICCWFDQMLSKLKYYSEWLFWSKCIFNVVAKKSSIFTLNLEKKSLRKRLTRKLYHQASLPIHIYNSSDNILSSCRRGDQHLILLQIKLSLQAATAAASGIATSNLEECTPNCSTGNCIPSCLCHHWRWCTPLQTATLHCNKNPFPSSHKG